MTKRLPPKAIGAGRAAADARERLAEKLFDPETVLKAIVTAAAAGFCRYVITPEQPFDLQNTAAAIKLVAFLKEEKFLVAWESIINNLEPTEAPYFALRIGWTLSE